MARKWEKFKGYFENADCQMHTIYTDGKSTPEEYFAQAEANGLDFILFSEHVRRITNYDYLKFKEHVYAAGAKSKVKFAVGAEAKVLNEEGDIDISPELANEAEMILFSFHTPNFTTVQSYQNAIRNAALNPLSDVFAHPTCYHHWREMEINTDEWLEILISLKDANVCYEFNKKYELPGNAEIKALKSVNGLQYIYGSDSHNAKDLLTKSDFNLFKSLVK
jgi:putative hydrolase